jgi:hypothetical protein
MFSLSALFSMNSRELWSRILLIVGYVAMLVGALDPLEGSLAILPGSALLVLGTYLNPLERPWLRHRWLACGLIAVGVAALFGLSAAGGFGGTTGRSAWWAVLILPYLAGWALSILGPGAPRWVNWGTLAVGGWYLALATTVLLRANLSRPHAVPTMIAVGSLGLLIILGTVWRLWRRRS